MDKKGQGISINVIIIAVLALVVLVVLVVIFTGRIAIFEKGVSKEGRAELTAFRVQYGDCRPLLAQEETFTAAYDQATSTSAREAAKDALRGEVNRCKLYNEQTACQSGGCRWG